MGFVEKNFKSLNWKWLLGIPIVSLMLLPMCIGLYRQHGMEGIEFYFWTQSFGRITGQSEWENTTDPFFFVHTFLWCFIPFTILFLPAIFASVRDLFKNRSPLTPVDYASLGGFVFTMIALSFSKYKLPHYIFIVCPLASAICAAYLAERSEKLNLRPWFIIQMIFLALVLVLSALLIFFFKRSYPVYYFVAFPAVLFLSWLFWKRFDLRSSIIMISVLAFAFVNLQLNTLFYPQLLKYQSSSEVAFYIRDNQVDYDHIAGFHAYGHALSYYLDTIVPYYWDLGEIKKLEPGTLVYTNEEGINDIKEDNMDFQLIQTFDEFSVTRLRLQFLNPETREEAISKRFLIRLTPASSI
jgi:4-amino-4-deoxy-L-arabinose transferase-like glycosyltransferase